jgi:uncharacterized protein YdaU (DUF1376 family)
MAKAPFMPVFAADLLADTTHLSTEQFGAYVLILLATWRNNGKALADDDEGMAHVCRVGIKKWRSKLRPKLAPLFTLNETGWHQQRLEKEWDRVQQTLSKRRTAASTGGRASAASKRQANGPPTYKEASLPKDSESLSDSESLNAAREGKKKEIENPEGGRGAPLGGADIVQTGGKPATVGLRPRGRPPPCTAKSPAGKSPALKAKIRDQLVQKHARFLISRRRPEELTAYWEAMAGDDPAAAQRMLDATDARMRCANWDDMRQWKKLWRPFGEVDPTSVRRVA